MYRRTAGLAVLAVAALFVTQGGGVGAGEKGKPKKKGNYVHSVIFHLKKDAPADAARQIVGDCHTLLAKIPTVRGVWAGPPAPKEESTPKVAVHNYQVGLLVLFEDFEGLKSYLKHPLHDEFLKRNGEHIDRVAVYDFVNKKAKK
jgi:hypothetical protein